MIAAAAGIEMVYLDRRFFIIRIYSDRNGSDHLAVERQCCRHGEKLLFDQNSADDGGQFGKSEQIFTETWVFHVFGDRGVQHGIDIHVFVPAGAAALQSR